jgi:poly(3-hydroxybutyrate) depolymerase
MSRTTFGCCILMAASMLTSSAVQAAVPADFLYCNSARPSGSALCEVANTGSTGTGMLFRLYLPPGYVAGGNYPLILFLHGSGENGSNNEAPLAAGGGTANGALSLINTANQSIQKALMVVPQTSAGTWDDDLRQTQVVAILDQVAAIYSVNVDRVYITGLSLGGFGTWNQVKRFPTRYAAAVPQSGAGDGNNIAAIRDLPIWFFHALNDGTVGESSSGVPVAALRAIGGNPIYTQYATGGHGIWPTAYASPLLFRWMMAQTRGAPSTTVPPYVRIQTPTTAAQFSTGDTQIALSGSAGNDVHAIATLVVQRDVGADVAVTGIASWTSANANLAVGSNRFRAFATGSSYSAALGGATTFSDTLTITRTGTPPTVGSVVAAINSGGPAYTASDSTVFDADRAFVDGQIQVTSNAISGTADQALFQDWRWSNFRYLLPVVNGRYRVDLYLSDAFNTAAAQRRFNASIEGVSVLNEFDIIATVGANTATIRPFTTTVNDGELEILVANGSIGNAKLDALKVVYLGTVNTDAILQNGFE